MLGSFENEIDIMNLLTFSSILAAVDPIAALAIFQDIGVNMSLYFLVFGECLINDGVTVFLYNTMIDLSYSGEEDGQMDQTKYILAILSFFTVVFGGLSIGVLIGMASSFIVKFTRHNRVIEPLIILIMAYLAYILAETCHWSGIISVLGCGIAQRRYAFLNLSTTSHTTVKYSVRTLSTFSDCIIFLYLGIVTISNEHWKWHWELIAWTILLCTVFRFVSVISLTAMINTTRVYKISLKEQFIVGYGGLRGAVGFSLATVLSDTNPFKPIFLTATLAVIYFTVFLQGSTIKFFVEKLKINLKEEKEKKIFDDINERTFDQIMAGVRPILGGFHGRTILETIEKFDLQYIQTTLIHRKAESEMTLRFQEVALDEHYARLYGNPTMSDMTINNKFVVIMKPEEANSNTIENDESLRVLKFTDGLQTQDTRGKTLEAFNDPTSNGNLCTSMQPDMRCQVSTTDLHPQIGHIYSEQTKRFPNLPGQNSPGATNLPGQDTPDMMTRL